MKGFLISAISCLLLAPCALAILDTNTNGLSDFWERDFNNGNLFPATFDPQADSDHDGWNNAEEAAAGTNPNDPNPPDGLIRPSTEYVPAVMGEENGIPYVASAEAIRVIWPSIAGKQYTLSFSPDLTQGSWLPVGNSFIASGGVTTYTLYVNADDKRFWRVAVTDVDTDGDQLNDHEEHLAGTNPTLTDSDSDTLSDLAELVAGTDPLQDDADGDGWTDPQEITASTDSNNQDGDGDGIPDPIDAQPLVNAFIFADEDGDGIADQDDAQPANPRGPAPSLASENSSGNPDCDLIKDEIVKFVLTVSNPAGPAPTASDLTFFLNGTEETTSASISVIGNPVASSQRFLLTWTAKTTTGYPNRTLQNLTLRFRDPQQATSWFKLARIDVAEWEGMIAGTSANTRTSDTWSVNMLCHSGGRKERSEGELCNSSWHSDNASYYRGPREIRLMDLYSGQQLGTVDVPTELSRPLFIISRGEDGKLKSTNILDLDDHDTDMGFEDIYINHHPSTLTIHAGSRTTDLAAGATVRSTHPAAGILNVPFDQEFEIHISEDHVYNSLWGVNLRAYTHNHRLLDFHQGNHHAYPVVMGRNMLHAEVFTKITAHSAGTLEYPGLPIADCHTDSYRPALIPLSQETWHKIVLKVGPDAEDVANGIGLWLRNGADGAAAPQTGFALRSADSQGVLTDLTVPADGKITLAVGTPDYQQLISPSGLAVFIKRDENITDAHDLSLHLLKKHEWYAEESVRIASLEVMPVDMDFIKPGTEKDATQVEIAESEEDSEGEIVGVNWDDDDNSEGNGGHAKLVFKNDFDDPNGTVGEDDLIQLKLHKPAVEGAKARLKYDGAFVKVWLKADRKDEVKSEDTEIDLTEDKIVYLEGRKVTEAESPKEIEMQIKVGAAGPYAPGDEISVHVATPVITFSGKNIWTDGRGSINLAEQLHDEQYLGKNRRDERNNTVILKGKNNQGKMLWYSVDMVDTTPSETGDAVDDKPLIRVRAPSLDKEMKMALSLEGSHVFYNGHSNFGLGPNFNVGGTTTVDDYMNLSGRGMTAIIVKSDDPDEPNPMATLDHGGPAFALRPADPLTQVTNYTVPVSGVPKFTGPAVGAVLTKQVHADGMPYHYERQGNHNNWLTIVNSTGDVPVLRYASCFMASCNTGRHFPETLNHGVLLFSIDETYAVLGGDDAKLENDLTTDDLSWGITQYIRLLTEGKTWTEIVTFFNQNQSFQPPATGPESLHNYKCKTF